MANDTSKELRALVRRDRDERMGPFDPGRTGATSPPKRSVTPQTKSKSCVVCSTTAACRSTTRAPNAAFERSSSVAKTGCSTAATHAESAAAIFSLVASCRLHSIEPQQYLDEVMRVLPYWPKERHIELAPKYWKATREELRADELGAPLASFTIPAA